MPGLVKIGKTTRNPSDRADELSNVTGLPTPFIIVFEQLFEDCTAAEQFVHTLLGTRGFRVAQNREFFNAPVNDVIRAILSAPGAIDEAERSRMSSDEDSTGDGTPPWLAVYEQAEASYYGLGNVLQDYVEALRLYKQALKLGCSLCNACIAEMYEEGKGTPANLDLAVSYYKEGIKSGHSYCYWRLALLFQNSGHPFNADKCALEFLKDPQLHGMDELRVVLNTLTCIAKWMNSSIQISQPVKQMICTRIDAMREKASSTIVRQQQVGDAGMVRHFTSIINYLNRLESGV